MTENLRPSGAHSTDQDPNPYASPYAYDGTAHTGTAYDGTAYAGTEGGYPPPPPYAPTSFYAGRSGRSRCWRRWRSPRA